MKTMKLKSILKRVAKAAPVIIANAPAVIAAARDVKKALRARSESLDRRPLHRQPANPT